MKQVITEAGEKEFSESCSDVSEINHELSSSKLHSLCVFVFVFFMFIYMPLHGKIIGY